MLSNMLAEVNYFAFFAPLALTVSVLLLTKQPVDSDGRIAQVYLQMSLLLLLVVS